jgi:dienelactone hydrolase
LFLAHDIFGHQQNKFELSDQIHSKTSWTVVCPDYFHGQNWDPAEYPPKTEDQQRRFAVFLSKQADAEARAEDTRELIEYFRSNGRSTFSLIGLCWGCKLAAIINDYPGVVAITGAHPSFLEANDGEMANVATLWLPTPEDKMAEYISGVESANRWSFVTVDEDFMDMYHGFMGARGQWDDPKERSRVEAARDVIINFTRKQLKF